MTKVIAEKINNYREKIFAILAFGIITSSILYAYFLHGAISNVVERESIVKETRLVSAKIGELEANYFDLKNDVDLELAHAKGFKDGEITVFISKKTHTAMANHNEL